MTVILSTPIYVWCILCYILFVGIKEIKTRIVYMPKLFIIPVILITLNLKYKIFISENVFLYLCFMLIGGVIGFKFAQKIPIKILHNIKSIELPGSYITMFILLLFFCMKYIFGYIEATNYALAERGRLIDLSISVTLSGYFIGRTLYYLWIYFKMPKKYF